MIIVLKPHQKQEVVDEFIQKLTGQYGVQVNTWVGTHSTVLGLIGDTTPHRRGVYRGPGFCGERQARAGALQKGQPQVPPR